MDFVCRSYSYFPFILFFILALFVSYSAIACQVQNNSRINRKNERIWANINRMKSCLFVRQYTVWTKIRGKMKIRRLHHFVMSWQQCAVQHMAIRTLSIDSNSFTTVVFTWCNVSQFHLNAPYFRMCMHMHMHMLYARWVISKWTSDSHYPIKSNLTLPHS